MTPKDQPTATAEAEADQGPGLEEASEGSTALAAIDAPSFALERQPIIDLIPARQVALLKDRSPNLEHGELAAALELAWSYQLDPFANEIWFAKSKRGGKLLIMVGRDGLRKIAQRNGLEVDCDVVRERDTFRVSRGPDRTRLIHHEYDGGDTERGAIVGAWAECYERAGGRQRGFFYAPIGEYRPSSVDAYSPWGKQVSVMTLAAAERQAVRQATPLGGLLVEGEDVLVDEATGEPELTAPAKPFEGYPLEAEIEQVIERARELGHQGLASVATAQMALHGQTEYRVRQWLKDAHEQLDAIDVPPEDEDGDVQDAQVVDPASDSAAVSRPEPGTGPSARPLDGHAATAADAAPGAPDREVSTAERVAELREQASEAPTPEEADRLLGEADSLEAAGGDDQPSLGL